MKTLFHQLIKYNWITLIIFVKLKFEDLSHHAIRAEMSRLQTYIKHNPSGGFFINQESFYRCCQFVVKYLIKTMTWHLRVLTSIAPLKARLKRSVEFIKKEGKSNALTPLITGFRVNTYRAIATSLDSMSDSEIISWYAMRAEKSENKIKELMLDFGGALSSTLQMKNPLLPSGFFCNKFK